MRDEERGWGIRILVAVFSLSLAVAALVTGLERGAASVRQEAVRAGHAIWAPNEKGETRLRWLPPCVKKEVEPGRALECK